MKSLAARRPQRPAASTKVGAVAFPVAVTIPALFPSAVLLLAIRILSASAGCLAEYSYPWASAVSAPRSAAARFEIVLSLATNTTFG